LSPNSELPLSQASPASRACYDGKEKLTDFLTITIVFTLHRCYDRVMNKWWSKERDQDDDEIVDPSPLGYVAVEAKYDWRPGLRL
jgi:hypothetical protein